MYMQCVQVQLMYLQVCNVARYHVFVSVAPEAAPAVTAGSSGETAETGEPDDVVRAWRDMMACHAAVCAALEHELGERHALGVSDFEVLDRLAESPGCKSRAQELAESVHLSQSALSRLVDRLVRNGLVERCACDNDRRGIYAVLTEEGLRRHAAAAVTHRDILARLLPR
jgi:DNA-binding MarR family transcriptional regulator